MKDLASLPTAELGEMIAAGFEPTDYPYAVEHAEAALPVLVTRVASLADALRGVSNAYGCFAGCTGALPGAPEDGSGHTPACRAARTALEAAK